MPLKQIRADCEGLLFHFILLLFFSFPFLSSYLSHVILLSFIISNCTTVRRILLCYEGKKIRWNPVLSLSAAVKLSSLPLYSLHLTVNGTLEIVCQEGKGFFAKWKELNSLSISSEKYSHHPHSPLFKTCSLTKNTYPCLRAICSAGAILESPLYKMSVCPWKL